MIAGWPDEGVLHKSYSYCKNSTVDKLQSYPSHWLVANDIGSSFPLQSFQDALRFYTNRKIFLTLKFLLGSSRFQSVPVTASRQEAEDPAAVLAAPLVKIDTRCSRVHVLDGRRETHLMNPMINN